MASPQQQDSYDKSYHEKLEQFKQRKNARLEQLHKELDGTYTPLLNSKTQELAVKNPDLVLPAHERLAKVQEKQKEKAEYLRQYQREIDEKELTFRPEITEAGKAFTRDKPLIEALNTWQSYVDEKRKTKQKQKELAVEEEMRKPVYRPAQKRSDTLVSKSKYGNLKPEDRLLAMQADALQKYASKENKYPDQEEIELKESTFSPKIDYRSSMLAASKQRDGDVFETLYRSGVVTEKKKQEMNKQKYTKQPATVTDVDTSRFRENDILRRYEEQLDKRAIEMAIAEEEDRQRRQFKMTESSRYYLRKREEELLQNYRKTTYRKPVEPEQLQKPQICEKSQRLVGDRADIADLLYKKANAIKQRLVYLEYEGKKADMAECTFQPYLYTTYEIKSTFEERAQRAQERRQKMIDEIREKETGKNNENCTFRPRINGDEQVEKFRKSAIRSTLQAEAAKSSELEVQAINQHIQRYMKSRVYESPYRKTEWSIEPTVYYPFKASYVSQNASVLRPEIDEDGAKFLDDFDINMARGITGEVVESPIIQPAKETVVIEVNRNLTNFHKIVASVKYYQTDNEMYRQQRDERSFLQAAGMV